MVSHTSRGTKPKIKYIYRKLLLFNYLFKKNRRIDNVDLALKIKYKKAQIKPDSTRSTVNEGEQNWFFKDHRLKGVSRPYHSFIYKKCTTLYSTCFFMFFLLQKDLLLPSGVYTRPAEYIVLAGYVQANKVFFSGIISYIINSSFGMMHNVRVLLLRLLFLSLCLSVSLSVKHFTILSISLFFFLYLFCSLSFARDT